MVEVEVSREELFAVHLWNSAQLIKRRQRRRLCNAYLVWRNRMVSARSIQREQLLQEEAELSKEQEKWEQTLRRVARFNERLRNELHQLGEEKNEIELATDQVRQELRGIRDPTQSAWQRHSPRTPF